MVYTVSAPSGGHLCQGPVMTSDDTPQNIVRRFNIQAGSAKQRGGPPVDVIFLDIKTVPPSAAHLRYAETTTHSFVVAASDARRFAQELLKAAGPSDMPQ